MTQKQWVQIQLVEGDHHTIVVGAVSSADTIRVIVRGSMGKLTRRAGQSQDAAGTPSHRSRPSALRITTPVGPRAASHMGDTAAE